MANSAVIDKLNDILRHEWTGVAQYAQAGFVVSGLWREVYSKMFYESAEESFGHAKRIGEKIAALGGVPSVERNPINQSNDLVEMLTFSLEFESKAVEEYTAALALVGDSDRALTVLLEDILLEEQDGVDEISRLLTEQKAAEGKDSSKSSKAG